MRINRLIDERPYLVLPIALVALLLPIVLIELQVARASGGVFMYPLDDTFIHMTVAKTLALHGNWGIAPGDFESASSSVGYTLLLAGLFRVFSIHAYIPFLINLVAAILVLWVVDKRLRKEQVLPFGRLIDPAGSRGAGPVADPGDHGDGAYVAVSLFVPVRRAVLRLAGGCGWG
jgi:hypothetical protein